MIVKDGAHLLYRILDKIKPPSSNYTDNKPKFDQVVIVDTGSTDGTVQLLKEKYPWVEVYEEKWEFDFSIARNQALSHIKTDVWMWLDSDDTFNDDTLKKWFEIAQSLWDKRNEKYHPVYALVPYIYEVDKNDLPVVVHFRERIMLGTEGWQWREPLHEVCYYNLPNGFFEAFNDCPVVHRPVGEDVAQVNGDRNWKILMHQYVNGDRSDRTLYYIGRMANMRGQYEFTLQVAPVLLERGPGGYYEYESALACGEAYSQMYKRDKISEYKLKAIEYLNNAKRFEPSRNDARQKLCDLYIHDRDTEEALNEALAMNENMPATVATTLPAYYGKYKYSILAMIYFRLVGNAWNAMCNHFKALDCPKPHQTTYELEPLIRAYLEDHEIGVIYADPKYVNQAMGLRKELLQRGTFREVYVFNDPHCIAYARNWYFHFTEKESTLYQEDGHPRLRKILISPYADKWSTPFGYEWRWEMPERPTHLSEILDTILDNVSCIEASSMQDALDKAMECRTEKAVISFVTDYSHTLCEYEDNNPTPTNKLRFVVNNIGDIVGITGWVNNIVTLYIDNKGILRTMSQDDCEIVVASSIDDLLWSEDGVRIRLEGLVHPNKRIVIVAPGLEDWDGTTPRRWGIGASESCVVYMAEQMVKRGHSVTVFNTTFKSRVVAGVAYVNMTQCQDDGTLCDLYISSRIPEAMNGRRGKLQVLWMHDIPEAYVYRMNNTQVIDRFITISKWQQEQAVKNNFKASKCRFIPNGLVNWPDFGLERVPNRTIWVSQPERGLDNIHLMWQKKPELFKDFWVVYGFFNLLTSGKARNDPNMAIDSFYDTCRFKFALRQMGAKIVGRVPHKTVQMLAQTSERWLYPSVFPETFCVAGLEVLHNGVQCYFTDNGGTAETLNRVVMPEREAALDLGMELPPRRVCMASPVGEPFNFDRDGASWLEAVEKHAGINREIGLGEPLYYWERVADDWEALFNGQ